MQGAPRSRGYNLQCPTAGHDNASYGGVACTLSMRLAAMQLCAAACTRHSCNDGQQHARTEQHSCRLGYAALAWVCTCAQWCLWQRDRPPAAAWLGLGGATKSQPSPAPAQHIHTRVTCSTTQSLLPRTPRHTVVHLVRIQAQECSQPSRGMQPPSKHQAAHTTTHPPQ